MAKVKVRRHIPAGVNRELLKKLVDVAWRFDPYCGLFYEELYDQTAECMTTKDGQLIIVNDLIEMLNEALD